MEKWKDLAVLTLVGLVLLAPVLEHLKEIVETFLKRATIVLGVIAALLIVLGSGILKTRDLDLNTGVVAKHSKAIATGVEKPVVQIKNAQTMVRHR